MKTLEITRFHLFAIALLFLTGCNSPKEKTALKEETTKQPNIILILTDDQGYGDLSCHGNPWLKTPNIDKLHSESTRLTDFHVSPTCSPTRAALLTGHDANRTGVWHTVGGRSQLKESEVTIAQVLKNNGYKTGIFGKWHLGDNAPFRPQDKGFDEVLIHGGGGVGQQPDFWDNDYFDDTYFHNGTPKKFEGYCTDVWFDNASSFIKEKSKDDSPFFCYVSTNAPHGPYYVSDSYSNQYKDMEGVANPFYYGMVANLDENVGKMMQLLESLKIADDTIVIFMTDNGVGKEDKLAERTLITDSQRIEYPEKWKRSATMQGPWRLINGKELYNIKTDPSQSNDVASEYPEKLKELTKDYDQWWEALQPALKEYPAIHIGGKTEKVSYINTMDLHIDEGYREVPWHQKHIRTPLKVEGWYATDFKESGRYRFKLYRWPREIAAGLRTEVSISPAVSNTNVPNSKIGSSLPIKEIKVSIDDKVVISKVKEGKAYAEIEVDVESGFHRLRTDFLEGTNGKPFSAYYVAIEKVGE